MKITLFGEEKKEGSGGGTAVYKRVYRQHRSKAPAS